MYFTKVVCPKEKIQHYIWRNIVDFRIFGMLFVMTKLNYFVKIGDNRVISKTVNKYFKRSEGIKSGIVFTIATLFTKGLSIITVPIFTRIMTSEQVGIVNLYNSWFTMIGVVATLSLTSGGYQLALKEFGDEKDKYESSVLTLTTLTGLILLFIFSVAPSFWSSLLGMPESLGYLLCFGFIFSPAQEFWMSRQRFDYKYKLSGTVSILTAIFASIISVYTVLSMNRKGLECTAEGRLFANNVVVYGVSLCFSIYIFAKGKMFFNKKYWSFSLSLSLPLIGHSIAKQILDVSDRQMISHLVDNSAVGIYSTLYSVSSLSLIVWNAINAAYVPYLFKNIEIKDKHKDIRRSSFLLLFVYTLIAFMSTYMAPEIVTILAPEEYSEAIYIMPPIAMGVSLTAVSNMYSNVLVYYKKTKYIMIASITAAICNLTLNYVFIKMCGYKAAAYTTMCSFIILALIEAIIASKVYKRETKNHQMIYLNKRILTLCAISFLTFMLALPLYSCRIIRYCCCLAIIIVGFLFYKNYTKNT